MNPALDVIFETYLGPKDELYLPVGNPGRRLEWEINVIIIELYENQ